MQVPEVVEEAIESPKLESQVVGYEPKLDAENQTQVFWESHLAISSEFEPPPVLKDHFSESW